MKTREDASKQKHLKAIFEAATRTIESFR